MKRVVIVAALLAASVHGARGFPASARWEPPASFGGRQPSDQARLPPLAHRRVPEARLTPSEQRGKGSPSNEVKVDLGKETVGRPPATFEPMVGTWLVARDGGDKVIMVDGRPWVASKDNPTKLLIESARRLYGTTNEELMDNAKQFAYFPVAVLRSLDSFTNGTISVKFKTIAGDADRASGILFNVKPNGDWLAVRYNDTENNVALWEFHNGMRRNMRFSDRTKKFMLDRAAWHELKLDVQGADLKTWLDGVLALEYTLGTMPGPGRNSAPPNPDLIPANNAVLRPPVIGKVGLWAKTDSTSYFKDYVVSAK
jgi:hypothetical protein